MDRDVTYTPIRGNPPPPSASTGASAHSSETPPADLNPPLAKPRSAWASTRDILTGWTSALSMPASIERRQQSPDHYAQGGPLKPGEKPIIIPVRVEPKVVFANERTFLTWMHFAVVLTTLSVTLLNFADTYGQIAGLFFTVSATVCMVYGLMLFLWRSQKIRNRDREPYDSISGPMTLAAALFLGIFLNMVLRVVEFHGKGN